MDIGLFMARREDDTETLRERRRAIAICSLPPGTLFADRYEVKSLLGRGGMGVVHRARDRELDEEVALKLFSPNRAASDDAVQRFRREVKLARRVTHSNVARTYDLGSSAGQRFLTMELIKGETLAERMRARGGRLGLSDALRIVSDVTRGLEAAHAAGVVHRDLKPANVMLDATSLYTGAERAVITDFGVAVLASTQDEASPDDELAGTPAYMAPEQVQGMELDGRADIYALGVVLFELLTGERPFSGENWVEVAIARVGVPPPDVRERVSDVPVPVAELVRAMLAPEREDRLDAARLAERLDALRGLGTTTESLAVRWPGKMVGPGTLSGVQVAVLPVSTSAAALAALSEQVGAVASAEIEAAGMLEVEPAADSRARDDARSPEEGLYERARPGGEVTKVQIASALDLEGGEVRLRAIATDASSGAELWSTTVSGPVARPLVFGADVVRALWDGFSRFGAAAGRRGRVASKARELYERARELSTTYGSVDRERAIALLREADALAPNDPLILSALAAELVRLWGYRDEAEVLEAAEDAALRALAIDSSNAEIFNTIALLRLHQGELRAAVRAFHEALARDSSLVEAQSYLGRLLSESGSFVEATQRLEYAMRMEPSDHFARVELARIAAMAGRWKRVDALLTNAGSGGGPPILIASRGRFAIWQRDFEALGHRLREMQAHQDDPALGQVVPIVGPAWAALACGRGVASGSLALRDIENAIAHHSQRLPTFHRQLLAEIHMAAGNRADALAEIESAASMALIDVSWLDYCPLLADLRGEPRFAKARALVATRAHALWR